MEIQWRQVESVDVTMFKLFQKTGYDFLNSKYGVGVCFIGFMVILITALHFGEVSLILNGRNKSIRPTPNNIGGNSYHLQLCQDEPVDAVYTWVNGSDPIFLNELRQTTRRKRDFQSTECPFRLCVASHVVIVSPVFPSSITLNDLRQSDALFSSAFRLRPKYTTMDGDEFSVVYFNSVQSARDCVNGGFFIFRGRKYTVDLGFVTNEWTSRNTVLLNDILILSEIPPQATHDEVLKLFPLDGRRLISQVVLFPLNNVALITCNGKSALESLLNLEESLRFYSGESPVMSVANLAVRLSGDPLNFGNDIGHNRFYDNEELRYSLRSLEKNAPWIRHVFLVTNGQIPSWLNLDNKRISLISHEEIFRDQSHLPTFSSPAIETHLHRIDGLSKRFLYLNDDVFFGTSVWPEDFYSLTRGQKVYLSWPVPDCRDDCPIDWIADGYCDKSCNNFECQWDGGDCSATASVDSSGLLDLGDWQNSFPTLYCRRDCATLWIGDKSCDSTCDVKECVFDGGDCGINNFSQLHEIRLQSSEHEYWIPRDISSVYLNLSGVMGPNGVVNRSYYEVLGGSSSCIQAVSANHEYLIMTLLFVAQNAAALKLRFSILGSKQNANFEFQFTLAVSNDRLSNPIFKEVQRYQSATTKRWFSKRRTPSTYHLQVEDRKHFNGRRLLDAFADSLRHVNRLLNTEFGYEARRVPAHMAHMFDRDVIAELERRFGDAFEATSAHQLRSDQDLQLAFAYFYFLMSERRPFDLDSVFDQLDTDGSGNLSDQEIRVLLIRLYDLPLTPEIVKTFREVLKNCSHTRPSRLPVFEMPKITKNVISNCEPLLRRFQEKYQDRKRYTYEVVDEEEVAFKMISANLTRVTIQLDEIKAKPRKFVCLNDNINHGHPEAAAVRGVLRDFYESLFPSPSQFELPRLYKNRFLHIQELRDWKRRKDRWHSVHLFAGVSVASILLMCIFRSKKILDLR